MSNVAKTIPKLANMLRTAEQNINKRQGKAIMMVQSGKGKGKKKPTSGQKRKDAKKASTQVRSLLVVHPRTVPVCITARLVIRRGTTLPILEECSKKKGSETSASSII